MEVLQLEKLKKLLIHCKENVPFYSAVMHQKNIDPTKIDSIQILDEFPIVTKEIIKDNYNDFIPKNLKTIAGVKISQTGGTTGNILFKRTDANVRSSTWATYKRFQDWMGQNSNSKILSLMGGHISKQSMLNHFKNYVNAAITNTISFNPYDTSEINIERIIAALRNNKFDSMRGYSQSLFDISNNFKSRGISFTIPSITTTAEPLMPEHRKLFKEIFNAESFDQYGCGEIGGVAYECDHHKGLHVAEERVILEFKDEYDILLTDLDNYAMPYLRYWNADQAISSKEKCTCGRESMLFEKIMGRTCDYLTSQDGKQLHWAFFWHFLFDTKIAVNRNMKKFQVVQKNFFTGKRKSGLQQFVG